MNDISQGGVATQLRFGGIFSDSVITFSPDPDSEIIIKMVNSLFGKVNVYKKNSAILGATLYATTVYRIEIW